MMPLAEFIESLADVPWFSRTGESDRDAIVAKDLVDAWDGWNQEMLAVWGGQTQALETVAVVALGESGVQSVFETVSIEMDAVLRAAIEHYYDARSNDTSGADRGIWIEWLDSIKRDLCWAAVEAILHQPGFFSSLLRYYRAGRWPCAWESGDQSKRVVLL